MSGGGRPLTGLRVVVTRARDQARSLARRLAAEGAEVELLPLVEVVPPTDPRPFEEALRALGRYEWAVFASANAVDAVLERLRSGPGSTPGTPPVAWPESLRTAVVGGATARALRDAGIQVDLVASGGTGESLAADLATRLPAGSRILVPRAADGRPELLAGLRRGGLDVTAVEAYAKRLPAASRARADALFPEGLGWVTFTSPSIARSLAGLFGSGWAMRRETLEALSIGPTTTTALRELGVDRVLEAAEPSVGGLVEALVRWVGAPGRPNGDGEAATIG